MQQEGHLRLGQQLLQLLHLHLEMLQLLHGCDAPFSASLHLLHPLLLPLLPLLPPLLCLLALAAYGRQQRVVPISPLPTSYICLIHIPKTRAVSFWGSCIRICLLTPDHRCLWRRHCKAVYAGKAQRNAGAWSNLLDVQWHRHIYIDI